VVNDQVAAEIDSLYNANGAISIPKRLESWHVFLNGFRINPDIIKDEQGSPIKLATGEQEVLHNIKNLIGNSLQVYPEGKHQL
jgi:hypothetical protein